MREDPNEILELAKQMGKHNIKNAMQTLCNAGILTRDKKFTENYKHLEMDEFESANIATEFQESQEARRYNKDKPREELNCNIADKFKIRRYTKGAEKYTVRKGDTIIDDGANNWKKGLSFKELIGSLKRHIAAIERGEDIDYDWDTELNKKYGLSTHYDGIMWNAEILLHHYMNNYKDDRDTMFYNPRIALDLDGVVMNMNKLLGLKDPQHYADPEFYELYENLLEFPDDLHTCPIFEDALHMPFEPVAYITARGNELAEQTKRCIIENNLPNAPVIHTEDKLQACRDNEVEIFVEDRWDTFCKLNNGGVKTYLMDRRYNRKHDAKRLRINSLKEII